MTKSAHTCRCPDRSSVNGASVSLRNDWQVWKICRVLGARPVFPPELIMQVKAIACELPKETGQPLSRYSCQDLVREVTQRGIVAKISGRTIWRWLDEDAIRPWQHRSVEFEYERGGALAYLAAWDVRRARVFGRCESTTGIEPFDRLVHQVMEQEPYRSAQRVFWIVDNGSSHRGAAAVKRLQGAYNNIHLVHLPVHASWLNQVEIYFSVIQRKVLTPNDFTSLQKVSQRLLEFQELYMQAAKPFEWKFTRADLQELLSRLKQRPSLALAA